ncbi:MAG: twin-arginine translocase subunit TatC [Acidobacteria bacterium]|nr:twin-arginine translocase subunit TatC [Acidobacteriota bacterium]MBA3888003.1 twin-arginine translocase subunit TatC [Acidobacteriota bacterium]
MALVPSTTTEDPNRQIQLTDPDSLEDGASKMSFLEHLEELRRRLINSALSLVAGVFIAFFFLNRIVDFVLLPLRELLPEGSSFQTIEGPEYIILYLKIGLLAGLFVALPLILWQVWLFIAPGLYAHEKRFAIPFVAMTSVFFFIGAAFAHYLAFPYSWDFFVKFQPEYVQFMPRLGPTFSLYVKILLAFALIFQMPTVVLFLARMGMVTPGFLVKHTKYAVLIIFILAAFLTPADVVSQFMMAGPMILLYGLSIGIAWVFGRRKPS